MKLLLTSGGVTNPSIERALVSLLGKPVAASTALAVPTATYGHTMCDPGNAWRFLTGESGAMCGLGWASLGVLELTALPSLPRERWVPWVEQADALLVDGGDAAYLAHWMRASGLADLLPALTDTVWVGLSAGSMVLTPRIGEPFVTWRPEGWTDETLGVVDFSIYPHVGMNPMEGADRWVEPLGVAAYAVDDQTAIQVVDGEVTVVSEGVWRHLPAADRATLEPPPSHDGPEAEGEQPPAPREFRGEDLSGARFVGCSLSGAVLRSVDVDGAEIDAPWLLEGDGTLLVNGVDVAPLVDAELDRRFPGRALRRADDPEGLREAWAALETTWAGAVQRAEGMPPGTVDASVAGEWSFAQTLRHLVMATDTWLGRAVLDLPDPYHPVGQPNAEYALDGHDPSVFHEDDPSWERVLQVRAERVAMVREHLASVTADDLEVPRHNPWAPACTESTLSCLRTILEEEWEHLRYAVRDLDVLEQGT